MPGRANLSEEGRESRPDPSRQDHDHEHTAFSPAIPPLDGHLAAGPRLGRLATVLAVVISGLLASAAAATAAFANPIPIGDGGAVPVAPARAATVRVISAGGMAGWQIALIAAGAAWPPRPRPCSWTASWPAAAASPPPPADAPARNPHRAC